MNLSTNKITITISRAMTSMTKKYILEKNVLHLLYNKFNIYFVVCEI